MLAGNYIICCDLQVPNDITSLILEKVIAIKDKAGDLNCKSVVQYTVTNNLDSNLFSLHDDMVIPIMEDKMIDSAIKSMLEGYAVFLLDKGFVDRSNIYGKLGKEHENEIVFSYDKK